MDLGNTECLIRSSSETIFLMTVALSTCVHQCYCTITLLCNSHDTWWRTWAEWQRLLVITLLSYQLQHSVGHTTQRAINSCFIVNINSASCISIHIIIIASYVAKLTYNFSNSWLVDWTRKVSFGLRSLNFVIRDFTMPTNLLYLKNSQGNAFTNALRVLFFIARKCTMLTWYNLPFSEDGTSSSL